MKKKHIDLIPAALEAYNTYNKHAKRGRLDDFHLTRWIKVIEVIRHARRLPAQRNPRLHKQHKTSTGSAIGSQALHRAPLGHHRNAKGSAAKRGTLDNGAGKAKSSPRGARATGIYKDSYENGKAKHN
jgi:hypothetical protein